MLNIQFVALSPTAPTPNQSFVLTLTTSVTEFVNGLPLQIIVIFIDPVRYQDNTRFAISDLNLPPFAQRQPQPGPPLHER
jgi:hypothetical protein